MGGAQGMGRGVVDLAIAVDGHAVFATGAFGGHQAVAHILQHADEGLDALSCGKPRHDETEPVLSGELIQ